MPLWTFASPSCHCAPQCSWVEATQWCGVYYPLSLNSDPRSQLSPCIFHRRPMTRVHVSVTDLTDWSPTWLLTTGERLSWRGWVGGKEKWNWKEKESDCWRVWGDERIKWRLRIRGKKRESGWIHINRRRYISVVQMQQSEHLQNLVSDGAAVMHFPSLLWYEPV